MGRRTAWLWAAVLLGCSGAGSPGGRDVPDEGLSRDPGAGDPAWTEDAAGGDAAAGGRDLTADGEEIRADVPGGGDEGAGGDQGPWDPAPADETVRDPGETGDPGAGWDTGTEEGSDAPEDVGAPDQGPGLEDPGGADPGPGPFTVRARPVEPEDVVASYLISLEPAAWNLFGGDSLPLGRHFDGTMGHVGYHSALRFPGLAVPPGARILSATLSFLPTNEVDSSNILWLRIRAEKSPDSEPLSLSDYDRGRPDQRLQTAAGIDQWVIRCNPSCTDLTEYDCPQRKRDCWDRTVRFACPKDLKALVQEVVDLPGWRSGNALTLILEPNVPEDYRDRDTGARHIVGVDAGRPEEDRPLLEVTWDRP